MTSDEGFYFSLLRISMIQLLRGHGFDKAKSSTIDLFTDLYVRYLELLIQEIRKLALERGDLDDEVALQDISQGMLNLGILKPMDILNVYDEDPFSPGDEGMQRFKKWLLKDPATVESRVISTPTPDLIKAGEKSNKPLSMIPEYINQLNVKDKKPTDDEDETELVEEMINNGDMDDWIRFTITTQQIEAARRKSGKLPSNIELLPSIPGLKYSKLNRSRPVANSECFPAGIENEENEEESSNDETISKNLEERNTLQKLLSKLPASNLDNRLGNIKLSYENEIDELTNPLQQDSLNDASMELENEEDEMLDDINTGGLTLGVSNATELYEMEDMQNTFERRESLDYGDSFGI